MAIIMRSIDINKTTVCQLAISSEVSRILWQGVTERRRGSPLSQSRQIEDSYRHKELVARTRKVLWEKIK